MTLRLDGNEVRVRLSVAEAEAVARGEPLARELKVPGGALRWRIDPGAAETGLEWRDGALVVQVSAAAMAALLQEKQKVDSGLHAQIPVDGGTTALAVEIDLYSVSKKRK